MAEYPIYECIKEYNYWGCINLRGENYEIPLLTYFSIFPSSLSLSIRVPIAEPT